MAVGIPTDLAADLGSALAAVEAEDRTEWSGPARAARVLDLRAALERTHAELARAVGDWDRDQAWRADESTSAQDWLADRAEMTSVSANRLVRTARLARTHERIGKALAAGEVTVAQVDELARVARNRESLFARDVDVLVDAAIAHSPAALTPDRPPLAAPGRRCPPGRRPRAGARAPVPARVTDLRRHGADRR